MIRIFFMRAAILASAGLLAWHIGNGSALSCNRYDGCGRETMQQSYDMMHNGGNDAAMAAARSNMEAFRAMQNQNSYYRAPSSAASINKAGK